MVPYVYGIQLLISILIDYLFNRCEMTLNYGSGRVWSIQSVDNSSKVFSIS